MWICLNCGNEIDGGTEPRCCSGCDTHEFMRPDQMLAKLKKVQPVIDLLREASEAALSDLEHYGWWDQTQEKLRHALAVSDPSGVFMK